ncbi:MAG: hypothetical protein KGQ59_09830 [Bdellovibrionales bacterium]|nr:hypothetical protein [Bdellovibrionales bacterium]
MNAQQLCNKRGTIVPWLFIIFLSSGVTASASPSLKEFIRSCPSYEIADDLVANTRIESRLRKADALNNLIPDLGFRRQQTALTRGRALETAYGLQGSIRNPVRLFQEFSIAELQSKSIESYSKKAKLETAFQLIRSYSEWKNYSEYADLLESWKPYFEKRASIALDNGSAGMIQAAVAAIGVLNDIEDIRLRLQTYAAEFSKCKVPVAEYFIPNIPKDTLQRLATAPSLTLVEQERICSFESQVRSKQFTVAKSTWIPEFRYNYYKNLNSAGGLANVPDWSVSLNFTLPLGLAAGTPTAVTRCDVELVKQRQSEMNMRGDIVSDYAAIPNLQRAKNQMGRLIKLLKPKAEVNTLKTDDIISLFRRYKSLLDQLTRAEINVLRASWEEI